MTTAMQDRNFGTEFLDKIIEWITGNMQPDEVFDLETLREHVKSNSEPDEVFDDSKLQAWAEANGFKKEEE